MVCLLCSPSEALPSPIAWFSTWSWVWLGEGFIWGYGPDRGASSPVGDETLLRTHFPYPRQSPSGAAHAQCPITAPFGQARTVSFFIQLTRMPTVCLCCSGPWGRKSEKNRSCTLLALLEGKETNKKGKSFGEVTGKKYRVEARGKLSISLDI